MMRVFDNDRGWERLRKLTHELAVRRRRVTVGVHADQASRSDELDNIDIGTIHEYGLGVPERSFIRATIDEHAERYTKQAKELLGRVLDGKLSADDALALLGEVVKRDIIQRINEGIDPPNAPATIAEKGSSKPLIDTGSLKQSIDYVVLK